MRISVADLKSRIASLGDDDSVLFNIPKNRYLSRVKLEAWQDGKMKPGGSNSVTYKETAAFDLSAKVWEDIIEVLHKHGISTVQRRGGRRRKGHEAQKEGPSDQV